MLSDRTYNALKWVAQIGLPALGALYFGLAGIWNLPAAGEVVGTVTVVDTFLGVVLGLASKSYNKSDARYDGMLRVEDGEDGSTLHLKSVDEVALLEKNEITFKISR